MASCFKHPVEPTRHVHHFDDVPVDPTPDQNCATRCCLAQKLRIAVGTKRDTF
ncbi:hypothetical protein shim_20900 [Shimia sp. SK013]|nr:hypothetical protein shim_20900 [Shimia sp. SK013]